MNEWTIRRLAAGCRWAIVSGTMEVGDVVLYHDTAVSMLRLWNYAFPAHGPFHVRYFE